MSAKLAPQIVHFLAGNSLISLATLAKSGEVDNAFVYYITDKTYRSLFITSHHDSAKLQNILYHPQVALAVADTDKLTTLQMRGTCTLIKDEDEVFKRLDAFSLVANAQNPNSFPPMAKLNGGQVEVVKIDLSWYRYSDFMSNPPSFLEGKF